MIAMPGGVRHGGPRPEGRAWCCRAMRLALASLILVASAACSNSGLILHNHALVGRIYEVKSGREIDREQALQRMASADVVLLGETHDNPAHHRLQLAILQALSRDRLPALAMEQFDTEHQTALDAAQGQPDTTADSLADAGKLSRKGWGWPLYQPLVEEAVQRGLPVVGINLSRPGAREVARQGFSALPPGTSSELLERAWNDEREARLADLIKIGHCNHIAPDMLRMIVQAQRARDGVMASALVAPAERGAVVILGRGHARTDVGVPVYFSQLAPSRRVISVGLVEVDESLGAAGDYEEVRDGVFDLVWFTPRFVRPDPCAALSAEGMQRAMSK